MECEGGCCQGAAAGTDCGCCCCTGGGGAICAAGTAAPAPVVLTGCMNASASTFAMSLPSPNSSSKLRAEPEPLPFGGAAAPKLACSERTTVPAPAGGEDDTRAGPCMADKDRTLCLWSRPAFARFYLGDRRQNSGVGGRPPQFSAEAAQASSCTQEGSGRSSTATPAA